MKRMIALLLAVIIAALFCVGGCSQKGGTTAETEALTTAPATTVASTTGVPATAEATTTAPPVETTAAEVQVYYEAVGQAPLYSHEDVFNVLLIGTDGNSNVGRSDTMMLLTLDNLHGKIKLTSFLRDTYVTIPGYSSNKLNAAYAFGGASLCIDTVEYNFGIDINGYAIINFTTFRNLINSIGGVDVYLTQDEINYINAQVAQNGQPNFIPEGTSEGTVHLTGGQALWHVRNRGGEVNGIYFYGTDWDRVDRQQRMFAGIIDGLRTVTISEVSEIAYTVLPYITTDLSSAVIAEHIANASTYLGYGIERKSVPSGSQCINGYYDHAGSVLEITDWDTLRRDVATFVYENIE